MRRQRPMFNIIHHVPKSTQTIINYSRVENRLFFRFHQVFVCAKLEKKQRPHSIIRSFQFCRPLIPMRQHLCRWRAHFVPFSSEKTRARKKPHEASQKSILPIIEVMVQLTSWRGTLMFVLSQIEAQKKENLAKLHLKNP